MRMASMVHHIRRNVVAITTFLAAFGVGDLGSQFQLRIGRDQELLGFLCVASQLTLVRTLRPVNPLEGLYDILLGRLQVAMSAADVHYGRALIDDSGGLGKYRPTSGNGGTH